MKFAHLKLFRSVIKNLLLQILFDNPNELQRFIEGPLCLCNVSAAVIAEIMLKKVMHMCHVSSCHPKGRKAGGWRGKNLTSLTLFNFARWAKQCGVAVCPAGLAQTFTPAPPKKTREGDLRHSFEKCPPCEPVLEPDAPSSFIDPHVWHVSITQGFG